MSLAAAVALALAQAPQVSDPVIIAGQYECFNCGSSSSDWQRWRNVAFNCAIYLGDGLNNHCTTAFNKIYGQAMNYNARGVQIKVCSTIVDEPCKEMVVKLIIGPLLTVSIPWIQNGIPILSKVTGITVEFVSENGDPHSDDYNEKQKRLPEAPPQLKYPHDHPFDIPAPDVVRFEEMCPGTYDLTFDSPYHVFIWREAAGWPVREIWDGYSDKVVFEVHDNGIWTGKIQNCLDDPYTPMPCGPVLIFGTLVPGRGGCESIPHIWKRPEYVEQRFGFEVTGYVLLMPQPSQRITPDDAHGDVPVPPRL